MVNEEVMGTWENTSFNRRILSRLIQVAKIQNISPKVYLKKSGDIIHSKTVLS